MAARVIDVELTLVDKFTQNFQKSLKAMTNATGQAQRISRQIARTGREMTNVGSAMTKTVSVPIVGAGVAALKFANDFENGIAKVNTIADTSAMSLDKIRQGTIDLSNEMGISVADISEAQYQAISAGVKTEDSFNAVRIAAQAAKAGFTDTATAIDGLTSVYNSYQGAVDYQAIADQMLMTQNYGKTTFGELAASMGQVTPIANSMNVSTKELFSSIAVLTKNGIGTSEAVTGLKAAYSNIIKPTADAQREAKRLGIEFNAAHLKSVGWAKFLEEIRDKTGGDTESLGKLFGSVEALNSVTVLAGSGFQDMSTALDMMQNTAGSTAKAYEKMLTPSERMSIALNKMKNAGIQFGTKLLPVFERVADVVESLADRFNNLSDEQVNMIVKVAAIAAAAGPVVMVFGKLVTGGAKLIGIFNKVKAAGGLVKLAFATLSAPIGIAVAAIAGIAAVIAIVIANFNRLKSGIKAVSPLFNILRQQFGRLSGTLAPFLTALKHFGALLVQVFGTVLTGAIAGAIGAFTGLLTGISNIVNGIMTVLQGIIQFIVGVFTGNWQLAWEGVKNIFTGIFESIVGVCRSVINGIAGAINGVIGAINGMGFTIPDWVPGIGGKSFQMSIPTIPYLAKGTDDWKGGIAQIHERGGEIIDLPEGTRVYPHDESIRKAREDGNKKISYNIAKLADQIIVREDADIDRIATALVRKLKQASGNMGGAVVGNMA